VDTPISISPGGEIDPTITRRWILFYDYVTENLVERRAPHRPVHIDMVREWTADGRMLMGGAVGDPPHSGLLVFTSQEAAEQFAGADPYVESGIVTAWRVEPWNVVS
jgi:uncharacterized protein YciI